MSDLIKRQDVLQEIRAEIKNCEEMHVNVSEDSLIRIVEQAEGFNSNEHFAKKIIKELEKEAQHSDKIVVGLGAVEDRMAQLKKSEAYRYAQEIVVNILDELKNSDEWIPCSQRLPNMEECQKNDTRFIVTDGNRVYQRHFDYKSNEFVEPMWHGTFNTYIDNCVIAWMSLPEPYRP